MTRTGSFPRSAPHQLTPLRKALPSLAEQDVEAVACSDWQGYGKPSGLEGKGSKGRGQGRHLATLEKPLPLTRVSRV